MKQREQNINNNGSLPLVALIGPTNAGKSTLFNRLTESHQAITAYEEATTRDRVYGEVEWQGKFFNLVDTGGFQKEENLLNKSVKAQIETAIEESDLVLFLFDSNKGLTSSDTRIINRLRHQKTVWLISNKNDSEKDEKLSQDYQYLGLPVYKISALVGRGVADLTEKISALLPLRKIKPSDHPIIAIIGRPNVGKSTLLNALSQSNRAIVSPVSGTTRDIVTSRLVIEGRSYLLADTAGIRRKGKIKTGIEKFSVKRALTVINHAKAVLVIIDATEGLTRGDLHLVFYSRGLDKPVLIIHNKIDLLSSSSSKNPRQLAKVDQVFLSALKEINLKQVINWIKQNVS